MTGGTRIHDNQSHNLVFYQLNYGHMEQVAGIEPAPQPWQGRVLADILSLHNLMHLAFEFAILCLFILFHYI